MKQLLSTASGANPTHVGQITASGMVFDLAWSPDGTMISDGKDVWNVILSGFPTHLIIMASV